jgi:hypothetical protein
MKTAKLNSILLECLNNPRWLKALSRKHFDVIAGKFIESGINKTEIDLPALRLLAGFITKVRHNPLRRTIPCTLLTLEKTATDLDLFADYAGLFAKLQNTKALDDQERTEQFARFLQNHLDGNNWRHQMALDVLNHEQILSSVKGLSSRLSPPVAMQEIDPVSIPMKRTLIAVKKCYYDPQVIIDEFLVKDGDPTNIKPVNCFLLWFWSEGHQEVSICQPTMDAAVLLSQVDGNRNILEIAESLSELLSSPIIPKEIIPTFAEMAGVGFVTFTE